jgi:hypothetical protein
MTVGIALWLDENPFAMVAQSIGVGQKELESAGFLDLAATAHSIGAPAALASAIALALLALSLLVALTRRISDEHLFLAALALLSLTLVYHRGYDQVMLIVPLLVAIRDLRRAWIPAVPILAVVVLVWIVTLPLRQWTDWMDSRTEPYFHCLQIVWYATLGLVLYAAIDLRRRNARPDPSSAAQPL